MGSKGTIISGRYELIRLIGEGGMGKVYEARHVQIGRKVALKILHKDFITDREVLERFHREASIAGNLGHANIIEVMDYGITAEGLPFIVMELLEGKSLAELLKEEGSLDVARAMEIMKQVLFALGEAHKNKIIHRDLKPENIFLADVRGRGEEIKILDFGISKVMKEVPAERLTRTGAIMGTPYYMSPEQVKGHQVDHRTDIYSCGIILFEMLTGQVPFVGNSYNEVIIKISTESVPDPKLFNPKLPGYIIRVMLKAMDKNPEGRFQNADEFLEALLNIDGIKLKASVGDEEETTAMVGKEKEIVYRDIIKKVVAVKQIKEEATLERKVEKKPVAGPAGTPVSTEARIPATEPAGKKRKLAVVLPLVGFLAVGILGTILWFYFHGGIKIGAIIEGNALPGNSKKMTQQQPGVPAHELKEYITIKFADFPDGAKVKYGDKETLAGELKIPKSNAPLDITIFADGYMSQHYLLIPDQDKILDATLLKDESALPAPLAPQSEKGKEPKASAAAQKEGPAKNTDEGIKKEGGNLGIMSAYPESKEDKTQKEKKQKKKKEAGDSKFKWDYGE
jgi:tRNA A-37 threonylcarbamoyl transferase component Bud32